MARALPIWTLLFLASCGEQRLELASRPALPATSPAEEAARARATLARMEREGWHEPVLAEVRKLHDGLADGEWVELGGWGLSRLELANYLRMSAPDETGRVLAEDLEREDHPVTVLAEHARSLAARGIRLVVVPIPKRLQVYPDRLPGLAPTADFAGADVPWERLLVALLEAGVEVIDLLPDFLAARHDDSGQDDPRLYLDYDPHWTPRAAELCAERIAERIRAFAGLALEDVRADVEVRREQGTFHVVCPLREGRADVPVWYRRVLSPDGRPSLASDPESEILVLGDSYATLYRDQASDLVRLIHARTGLRMDVVRREGGADGVWGDLKRRGDLSGKRLLVWILNAGAMGGTRLAGFELGDGR